jgi:symplekin
LFLSFFSRLLTSVPLITDNALSILKRYCSDEEKTNFGMNILYNLIIYRIPIREKCLDILINLIQNENNFIRNNAIDIVKNLYEKNQFKQLIEVKFCF